MEEILEKLKEFADRAHGEQLRIYTAERYIVHPVRVMNTCREFTNDITVLGAALLHDVLEDTPITEGALLVFLKSIMTEKDAHRTLSLVVDLTDVYIKKNYPQWNRRQRKAREYDRLAKTDPLAQSIKYADVIDNSIDVARENADFAQTSLLEYRQLLAEVDKGDAGLRKRAMEVVERELKWLKKNRG
ncbi:MAG: metal-dependent phosphohydrolase [Citrobacter freundii]|nr:MAG: metal-dependent phosphohydrolase [Citrobacter freundii]